MPRYFFDIFNGEAGPVDLRGHELDDEAAARAVALQTLADVARKDIPRGGEARITVRVRRNGVPIYSAVMTLNEQWIRLDS
ncbi:hypothetical protein ASE66_24045 [Bosea sp. Root483D1]|uniref:DUF6894 family protein n=1 Tax=Bosea sp. Root483D1 TaxID=1736544 RepID=UPI00070F3FF7|nr:hypothetical protein [Bosea sp. Root483D1]KRE11604.1 hypothetical protein ASE66_24045 [Bosea sp. Root483D1]